MFLKFNDVLENIGITSPASPYFKEYALAPFWDKGKEPIKKKRKKKKRKPN